MMQARRRIGVVGGGLAGVATAWLLDGVCDIVLFEADARLGGHARSQTVDYRGHPFAVDLGAQFFSPKLQPTFTRLLAMLGVYDPQAPDAGATITREMGSTVWEQGAARPWFVSPTIGERWWPAWTPWNAPGTLAFLAFVQAVRPFERDGDWTLPLDEWLRSVRGLTTHGRERVLLPWLSAMTGCSIDEARSLSARAAVAAAARGLPTDPRRPYCWSTAASGLGTVVAGIAAACTTLTTHLADPVTAVLRDGARFHLLTGTGRRVDVDEVVFAAPPHAVVPILRDTAGAAPLREVLGSFATFRARVVIHRDPAYVHPDRRCWSAYNATTFGGHCEGSVWYGAIRDRLSDGGTVDLFKSWATARAHDVREPLAEAEFRHALITPQYVASQARLAALQGVHGPWFAGSYTRDVDLQETALSSAVHVARSLAPGAPNLVRLTGVVRPAAP